MTDGQSQVEEASQPADTNKDSVPPVVATATTTVATAVIATAVIAPVAAATSMATTTTTATTSTAVSTTPSTDSSTTHNKKTTATTSVAKKTGTSSSSSSTSKPAAPITTTSSSTASSCANHTSTINNNKTKTNKAGAPPPLPPPVHPNHHPYAHHHYYAYHHHMAAAAAAADHKKKNAKSNNSNSNNNNPAAATAAPYTSTQYKKLGVGEAATRVNQQGVAVGGPAPVIPPSGPPPAGPPTMYPPPPPAGVPPHHHHAYHAWAAYRYAQQQQQQQQQQQHPQQQHPQYHGGPPPPPPPPPGHHVWNAEAYAASHQAYLAAASKAAASSSKGTKGSSDHGSSPTKGTVPGASSASAVVGSPPRLSTHHHYPHNNNGSPSTGPYRYSDPTLRRDALSRLSTPDSKNNIGTGGGGGGGPTSMMMSSNNGGSPSSPISATKSGGVGGGSGGANNNNNNNHSPTDPATLHMLELEARAEGATSPSQIEDFHREEVTTMGCTCKKTKCLKLYCQCFAVKIYCGSNCRCLTCSNNPIHESERQDAIRGILSRNPSAFDTKFQKLQKASMLKVSAAGGLGGGGGGVGTNTAGVGGGGLGLFSDIPHARTISHKLGCKCRKSACMKKYCECYAGNVKCSSNCRCVGCKNMPIGGVGDFGRGDAPPATGNINVGANNARTPTKNSSVVTTPTKKEPSWMMDAAQNLAFLKHGSAEKPKRIISRAPSEAGSMPSLASSSEGSPVVGNNISNKSLRTKNLPVNGARSIPAPSTAERAAVDALKSSEKTAVNALLMAAMAMTEMSGHDASALTTNNTDTSAKNTVTSAATSSPPLNNRQMNSDHYGNEKNCSPEATIRAEDDQFETPQKNLLKKFMSPKRKASDTNVKEEASSTKNDLDRKVSKSSSHKTASPDTSVDEDENDDEDESPKREHPGDGTPSLRQKIKRSRLGSLKKGVRLMKSENSSDPKATDGVVPMALSTPAKGTSTESKITDLTPVSARCIDFKKMRVNDSSSDPAVAEGY